MIRGAWQMVDADVIERGRGFVACDNADLVLGANSDVCK